MAHRTLDLIKSISALVLRVNLRSKTLRISVIFDAKCHLMRISVIKEFWIKFTVAKVVFWFKRVHVGVVEHRAHRIASSVLSSNFIVAQAAN